MTQMLAKQIAEIGDAVKPAEVRRFDVDEVCPGGRVGQ